MLHENALRQSLTCLYNEASTYKTSLDGIVQLAKSLRLDTFVDTDETPGVKRLSIAGSLLLLELDFKDDRSVIKTSLSLGNHVSETATNGDFDASVERNIVSGGSGSGATEKPRLHDVVVSFSPQLRGLFLQTPLSQHPLENTAAETGTAANTASETKTAASEPAAPSCAENILLASLKGATLGLFPKNLKYLADLDRVSPSEADLIVYIDNLATYLATIHHFECSLNPDDWLVQCGYTSAFGKVVLNDEADHQVGVFLQFWQPGRFLARGVAEIAKTTEITKTAETDKIPVFRALLAIEESLADAVDLLAEAQRQPWSIQGSSGALVGVSVHGETESAHLHNQQSVTTKAKWRLVLRFSHPVYLAESLLEYFGITHFERARLLPLDKYWQDAAQSGEICFENERRRVCFFFDEPPALIKIQALAVPDLHVLPGLMAALRNHLVMTAMLENLAFAPKTEYLALSDSATDKQANQRIRNTLQLSADVPDDELLALNTMSNDYIGVQMHNRDLELTDFIKDENGENDENDEDDDGDAMERDDCDDEEASEQAQDPAALLAVTLQEIRYGSRHSDLILQLSGNTGGSKPAKIDTIIRILNGRIISDKPGEDVDMDTETDASLHFTRSLALSEDLLLSLESLES